MAQKKLTDCPENLRESIDWLIQIKNGGDKTGLQNLAKALSTLINQAIEDADNSLKAEEKKLECPIIYEGNLSYCQFNDRSLEEAQKKLEELKDKQDPESESQLKQLENEIEQLKQYKQKCIDYTHPRYPESQILKDVRAKLKAFQELSKTLDTFLKDLQKTIRNSRDGMLHNLCTGLEKFLGYSSASKGYDGHGIVYSDLDRLCDGVMAFLHKCLDENKILLKHYYPGITDTISTLERSIGKGSGVGGFKKAIEKVKSGLMWYEIELERKTRYFADNLSDYAFKMVSRNADIEYSHNIGLSKVIGKFGDYLTNARDTMTRLRNDPQGFKGLDNILQNKLTVPLEKIEEGIQASANALQNDDYIQAINIMQATFDMLPDNVERFISEKVTNSIGDHKEKVERFKNIVKIKIDESRDKFLEERLPLIEKDLNNAVGCAEKDALNSGGFNNAKVKMAIEEIENRLKTLNDGTKPVLDDIDLGRLKSETVGVEIGNIKEELIEHSDVKDVFGSLDTIDAPQSIFNDNHGDKLSNLVKNAKADLENALKCAEEHAKNLGGLKNVKVAEVIRVIQEKLDSADNITTKELLINLKKDVMDHQVRHVMDSLNPDKPLQRVVQRLKSLENDIGEPQQIFDSKHKEMLEELVAAAQKEMPDAIDQSLVYIKCTDFGLNKKIEEVYNAVTKSAKGGKIHVSQMKSLIIPALKKIGEGITENFQSGSNNISPKLRTLETSIANAIESNFERKLVTEITEHDFKGWFHSYMSHVLKEANDVISKADKAYQFVSEQLGLISSAIKHIKQKAESGTLNSVISGLETQFRTITQSINTYSIYEEDRTSRLSYFDNLESHIKNTLNSLQVAYQQGYRSSAKTYLSEAISTIKAAVEGAEVQYAARVKVVVNFDELKEDNFTDAKKRSQLTGMLTASFTELQELIEQYSAFKNDCSKRTDCFKNLKTLIGTTVQCLSTAYKDAYQNSAKTYLTKALRTIKGGVVEVEKTYNAAVNRHIVAIKSKCEQVKDYNFKSKSAREVIVDKLTADFGQLETAVKKNSAFKADLSSREQCFENLKILIIHSANTFVKACERFDLCTETAKHCLDESFENAKLGIENLGDDITSRIKKAFEQIVFEVNDMHAKDKVAQLDALKHCMLKEIEEIKKIIEVDNRTGTKGFLKTLNGVRPFSTYPNNRLEELKAKKSVDSLTQVVKSYFNSILIYVWNDIEILRDSHFSDGHFYKTKVEKVKTAINELFNHLIDTKSKIYNYDQIFVQLLGNVKSVLTDLYPQECSTKAYPVLDALRKGLNGFTEQLGYAYINKYVGCKPIEWNGDKKGKQVSQDALRCARIFLTLIPEWDKHLPYLKRESIRGWNKTQINTQKGNKLGLWFECRGYRASTSDKTQDGELRNNTGCRGENINTYMTKLILKVNFGNLLYNLYQYYRVCQSKFSDKAKPPTTISQMLHWLCGLEYTPMYENMKTYLQGWYNDFKTEYEIEQTLPATVPKRTGHEVVTDFNLGNLLGSFENVTLCASDILLTILGYGDADGRYACEFYTNPYNLDYPTDKSKCFDLLVDICLRLNHQLRFLYMQCHNGPRSGGWADCRYGKNIAGSAWNCNRLQCVEQGCDQNCKWRNDCGVKSPLQSFLEDGLKGFLPHQFSAPSCKLECSVKNHNGIPCKTPMGFADISITASWTKSGRDIKKVLDPFCGTLPDSLSLLCAYFLCLLRRPPQTLCDMFAFYENFFEHWSGYYDGMRKAEVKKHKQDAFYDAVAKANFGVEYDGLDPTTMFGSSSHSGDDATHLKGDLFAIVNCKPNENPVHPCGSYLQPLSYEVRCVFTEKLAADYLSWIVYITETFYNLLNDLYNKCTKCCIQQQADCYGRICAKGCTVDSTPEPTESKKLTDKTHGELCNSIVQCPGIHPTIFAAGFTFGSPWSLSGDNGVGKKRSCKDFCTALGLVVKENNVLYMLVHEKIPAFLWEIRHKFFYTLVALWSYSLLYLLYVIIGRLDTFHIRSHLRLPSSHKISAQSLLAAARINNLAKLTYLRT